MTRGIGLWAVKSNNEAPVFFGRGTRYGHRPYVGAIDAVR